MAASRRFLLLALLLIPSITILGGCTFSRLQIGTPLDSGAESNLYAGQMKSEVLERLGAPDRVRMTWGEPVFEYLYRAKLGRQLELSFFYSRFDYERAWKKADRLVVRFDHEGRVQDYGIKLGTQEGD
jgi:outer membrane protein assembly factor BamE (lipoprotein component of BamABCDE complex)